MNIDEQNYLNLLKEILENGESRSDRTNVGTFSLFGKSLKFSLENNTIPLLTTKKIFIKGVILELLMFLRGETDTKVLENEGVKIWTGNTSREFLNKRGLNHLPEGNMGKMYGYQWRNFNGENVDQLHNCIELIKTDPHSRRIMVTALNPAQSSQGVLEPCHTFFQFYVDNNNNLSCQMYQRSCDYFLGAGFNIASYALLTHLVAKVTNTKAKELIMVFGDTHIYKTHIEQVKEQLKRKPYDFPKLQISKDIKNIYDIESLNFNDFTIIDYNHHPAIKAPMAI